MNLLLDVFIKSSKTTEKQIVLSMGEFAYADKNSKIKIIGSAGACDCLIFAFCNSTQQNVFLGHFPTKGVSDLDLYFYIINHIENLINIEECCCAYIVSLDKSYNKIRESLIESLDKYFEEKKIFLKITYERSDLSVDIGGKLYECPSIIDFSKFMVVTKNDSQQSQIKEINLKNNDACSNYFDFFYNSRNENSKNRRDFDSQYGLVSIK